MTDFSESDSEQSVPDETAPEQEGTVVETDPGTHQTEATAVVAPPVTSEPMVPVAAQEVQPAAPAEVEAEPIPLSTVLTGQVQPGARVLGVPSVPSVPSVMDPAAMIAQQAQRERDALVAAQTLDVAPLENAEAVAEQPTDAEHAEHAEHPVIPPVPTYSAEPEVIPDDASTA